MFTCVRKLEIVFSCARVSTNDLPLLAQLLWRFCRLSHGSGGSEIRLLNWRS